MTDRLLALRKARITPIAVEAGRLPPQAPELEEAVLGQLLLEKDAVAKIADMLLPETFYIEANQRIYAAIQALYSRGEPADILTVTEGLIQPPPEVGSPESTAYVSGVMTTDTGIVSLLSLDHILPPDIAAAA